MWNWHFSKISLLALNRRHPLAIPPGPIALVAYVSHTLVILLQLATHGELQPVQHVLPRGQSTDIRRAAQLVELVFKHPHFFLRLQFTEGFNRVFERAQRIKLAGGEQRRA